MDENIYNKFEFSYSQYIKVEGNYKKIQYFLHFQYSSIKNQDMKKLQHQNSWAVTGEESETFEEHKNEALRQTDLASSAKLKGAKVLDGKILLMEERNKSIQQFYENKILQLRAVLLQQGQTKSQLMQQMLRLKIESQQQNQRVKILKSKLLAEKLNTTAKSNNLNMQLHIQNPSQQKYSAKKSSKGKHLFSSNSFGKSSNNRIILKKCRSENFIESQYFSDNKKQSIDEESVKDVQRRQKAPNLKVGK